MNPAIGHLSIVCLSVRHSLPHDKDAEKIGRLHYGSLPCSAAALAIPDLDDWHFGGNGDVATFMAALAPQ